MSDLSDRIKQAIKLSGKNQCQIADEIGITEVSLSRYIRNNRIPKAPVASEIAKACGVSVEWLMTGKKQPSKHIEMIIDYVTNGSDFQYNDNHGVLTRCRDCIFADGQSRACRNFDGLRGELGELDFCSKAVRRCSNTE